MPKKQSKGFGFITTELEEYTEFNQKFDDWLGKNDNSYSKLSSRYESVDIIDLNDFLHSSKKMGI